jgi:hypothetical protein
MIETITEFQSLKLLIGVKSNYSGNVTVRQYPINQVQIQFVFSPGNVVVEEGGI